LFGTLLVHTNHKVVEEFVFVVLPLAIEKCCIPLLLQNNGLKLGRRYGNTFKNPCMGRGEQELFPFPHALGVVNLLPLYLMPN
jgi:hypothetical protein